MKKTVAILLVLVLTITSLGAFASSAYSSLKKGSKGDAVVELQTRLLELGFYSSQVDGSYGNVTAAAVKAFEEHNGLNPTGEATIELLELLFSDAAKAAPPKPDVAVTSVSKSNTTLKTTFKNNLDEKVTYIEYQLITYDNDGNIYAMHSGPEAVTKDNYQDVYYFYWYENVSLYPGNTKTLSYPLSFYYITNAPVIAVGVSAYVTQSGKRVEMSEYEIAYLTTDGKQIWPYESHIPAVVMTENEYEKARTIKWGYTSLNIPYFLSSYYMVPEGAYITEIAPNSIAEVSGLQVGDVIVRLNSLDAKTGNSAEKAKLDMLSGKDTIVEYWRNNQVHTTIFSLDPERMNSSTPSVSTESNPTLSIADELLKYAELLEKGLITQDEYDTLKRQLLD